MTTSPQLGDAPMVAVCMRRRDLPRPPVRSVGRSCELCGEAVWLAESTPSAAAVWCVQCAIEMAGEEATIAPFSEAQIEDIKRALG